MSVSVNGCESSLSQCQCLCLPLFLLYTCNCPFISIYSVCDEVIMLHCCDLCLGLVVKMMEEFVARSSIERDSICCSSSRCDSCARQRYITSCNNYIHRNCQIQCKANRQLTKHPSKLLNQFQHQAKSNAILK